MKEKPMPTFNQDDYEPKPMPFPEGDPRNPTINDIVAETGHTPEELGYVKVAVAAIGGVGATALSNEVQDPDAATNQSGFLKRAGVRVKNGLKQAWNEIPAVKAITDAGGNFSKWDVAKVVSRHLFIDTPINAALGLTAQYDAMKNRVDLGLAGGTSPTLIRKMAEGLPEGWPDRANPIQKHLEHHDTPKAVTDAVEFMKQRIQREHENPDKVMQRRIVGGCMLALTASTAVLAYKGLTELEIVSTLRGMSPSLK